jgi:hypothetical protein
MLMPHESTVAHEQHTSHMNEQEQIAHLESAEKKRVRKLFLSIQPNRVKLLYN